MTSGSPRRNLLLVVPLAALVACGGDPSRSARTELAGPQQFIFFNRERERIREPSFLDNSGIAGAQLKYTWRELEPERDRYAFGPLLEDLAFLESHGKRLFVQIQDVSFDDRLNVPDYLTLDPAFHGGADRKYEYDVQRGAAEFDGWVARRWDPAVIDRFAKLLRALGEQIDGKVEGISLAETAVGFGRSDETRPTGYSPDRYAEGIRAIMTAAGEAFPRSVVIQYANFMPGESLPGDDKGYLRGIYEHARVAGVGVGGPDLMPFREGQQNHCLKFIRERAPGTVAGLAVQWGNLEEIDPETGLPVTVERLHRFATEELRLDYLFWGTQEPFYSEAILPYLAERARG